MQFCSVRSQEFFANLTGLNNTHNEDSEELVSVGEPVGMDTDDPDDFIPLAELVRKMKDAAQ